jgi:hypothetical protein
MVARFLSVPSILALVATLGLGCSTAPTEGSSAANVESPNRGSPAPVLVVNVQYLSVNGDVLTAPDGTSVEVIDAVTREVAPSSPLTVQGGIASDPTLGAGMYKVNTAFTVDSDPTTYGASVDLSWPPANAQQILGLLASPLQ